MAGTEDQSEEDPSDHAAPGRGREPGISGLFLPVRVGLHGSDPPDVYGGTLQAGRGSAARAPPRTDRSSSVFRADPGVGGRGQSAASWLE